VGILSRVNETSFHPLPELTPPFEWGWRDWWFILQETSHWLQQQILRAFQKDPLIVDAKVLVNLLLQGYYDLLRRAMVHHDKRDAPEKHLDPIFAFRVKPGTGGSDRLGG